MSIDRSALLALLLGCLPLSAFAQDCEGVESFDDDTVGLEVIGSGFQNPVDVGAPAGDTERLFVVEQGGRIRIV
ncbi:MAG: hypothetical protein AAF517_28270, partial [Planctomycetota bacterium]